MRGIIRRSLRLQLVTGLGIALAVPALAMALDSPSVVATQTTLNAETRDSGGRTQATLAVAVVAENGLAATGAVAVEDHGRQVAGAALNAEGRATIVLALPAGDHSLRAVYIGDNTHLGSHSQISGVHALTSGTPDFLVSATPATVSLTAGQSGTVTATITPVNSTSLTAPMFVTLSCSGLPDQSSCTYTPENVEILPGATTAVNSSMVIQTQGMSGTLIRPAMRKDANPVAWAFLLPGALGLLGLAWRGRRRGWLGHLSLLAFLGLVTMLGATACAARYNYFNHGPPKNPATPSGTFTVNVVAQSSNGVTATTHSSSIALTVK